MPSWQLLRSELLPPVQDGETIGTALPMPWTERGGARCLAAKRCSNAGVIDTVLVTYGVVAAVSDAPLLHPIDRFHCRGRQDASPPKDATRWSWTEVKFDAVANAIGALEWHRVTKHKRVLTRINGSIMTHHLMLLKRQKAGWKNTDWLIVKCGCKVAKSQCWYVKASRC